MSRQRNARAACGHASEVYLLPGELFVAHQPTIIRTILGSCVGASFWDDTAGVGALFHAQLPVCPAAQRGSTDPTVLHRFVDASIRVIAEHLDDLGLARSDVQVKVFGGADVLRGYAGTSERPTVGRLNCEAALRALESEGFTLSASSLGGNLGVKLAFNTGNGEVLLRRLA